MKKSDKFRPEMPAFRQHRTKLVRKICKQITCKAVRRALCSVAFNYITFPSEKKDVFMMHGKKLFAVLLPLVLTACTSAKPAQTETVWAMDTACTISLHGGGVSETVSLLKTLDKTLDNYQEDSAISRLNQSGTISGNDTIYQLVSETAALQKRFGDSVDQIGRAHV